LTLLIAADRSIDRAAYRMRDPFPCAPGGAGADRSAALRRRSTKSHSIAFRKSLRRRVLTAPKCASWGSTTSLA